MSDFDFDVFVSFRHEEGRKTARWLRRWLIQWSLPTGVEAEHTGELKIFVDSYQGRPSSDYWEETIKPALLKSRWLVVIVTSSVFDPLPDGEPNWVIREIETYLDSPQAANIIPIYSRELRVRRLPQILSDRFPRIQTFDLASRDRIMPRLPLLEEPALFSLISVVSEIRGVSTASREQLFREGSRRRLFRVGWLSASGLAVAVVLVAMAIVAIVNGVEAIRTTVAATLRNAVEDSVARPDRAALLAAHALRTATDPPILNWFLGAEEVRAREILGSLVLPRSTIRVPGGRIEQLGIGPKGEQVAVLTEDEVVALYRAPDWRMQMRIVLPDGMRGDEIVFTGDHIIVQQSGNAERVLVLDRSGEAVADIMPPDGDGGGTMTLTKTGFLLYWRRSDGAIAFLDPTRSPERRTLWRSPVQMAIPEAVVHDLASDRLVVSTRTDTVGVSREYLLDADTGEPIADPAFNVQLDPTPVVVPGAGIGLRIERKKEISRYRLLDGEVLPPILTPHGQVDMIGTGTAGTVGVASDNVLQNRHTIYDFQSGVPIQRSLGPFELWTTPVFNADGTRIAMLFEGKAMILDWASPDGLITLPLTGRPQRAQFLGGGKYLSIAESTGRVTVWDVDARRTVVEGIFHEEGFVSLAEAAANVVVSGGWDGTVRFTELTPARFPIWLAGTPEMGPPDKARPRWVMDIDLDLKSNRLAIIRADDTFTICRIGVPQCSWTRVSSAVSVEFADNGGTVVVQREDFGGGKIVAVGPGQATEIAIGLIAGAREADVYVVAVPDAPLEIRYRADVFQRCENLRAGSALRALTVTPGGDTVVVAQERSGATYVDSVSTEDCAHLWSAKLDLLNVNFLKMNERSGQIIVAGAGRAMSLKMSDGSVTRFALDERHIFNDIVWSPNGNILYGAAMSRQISGTQSDSLQKVFKDFELTAIPWRIARSTSGHRLIIGLWADHEQKFHAILFDPVVGAPLARPFDHPLEVTDVAFTSDGLLVTAGGDGVVRVWPVAPDERSPDTILADVSARTAQRIEAGTAVIRAAPTEFAPN